MSKRSVAIIIMSVGKRDSRDVVSQCHGAFVCLSVCLCASQFLKQFVFVSQRQRRVLFHRAFLLHSLASFLRWRRELDATHDDRLTTCRSNIWHTDCRCWQTAWITGCSSMLLRRCSLRHILLHTYNVSSIITTDCQSINPFIHSFIHSSTSSSSSSSMSDAPTIQIWWPPVHRFPRYCT